MQHFPICVLFFMLGAYHEVYLYFIFIPIFYINYKYGLILSLFFSLSFIQINHQYKKYDLSHKKIKNENEYTKELKLKIVEHDFGQKYIKAYSPKLKSYVMLHSKSKAPPIGSMVICKGTLSVPQTARNPGQFNSLTYYRNKNIIAWIQVKQIKILKKNFVNPIKKIAINIKSKLLLLHKKTLPKPYSDLFIGLIFGQHGTDLPRELSTAYQRNGLIHLLVVSGSQVSLLTTFIFAFLNLFALPPWLRFMLLTLFQCIFYFITGGGTAVLRAILMCELSFALLYFGRTLPTIHNLAIIALMMGIFNPLIYHDIGFQLSFIATASLIFIVTKVEKKLPASLNPKLRTWIAVSTTPTLCTLPLLAYHFYTLSWVSFLSNLLIVFWIEFLVVYGFIITLVALCFEPSLILLNKLSLIIMILLNKLVFLFDKLPYTVISIGHFPIYILFISYFYLFYYLSLFEFSNKYLPPKYVWRLCLLLFIVGITKHNLIPKPFKLLFLDVGQGDASLILTPNRKSILIDAGPAPHSHKKKGFDAGRSVILPACRYLGINKIDYVFLSHADLDHYGGLTHLIKNIKIKNFISHSTKLPLPIRKLLATKNIPIKKFKSEKKIQIEKNTQIKALFIDKNKNESKNNNSLILLIKHKDLSILFTGDIEKEREEILLKYNKLEKIDVLKVAHHGSKTSSSIAFLNKTQAKVALIGVGQKNRFSHPSTEVLENLSKIGCKILRTDRHGAIVIEHTNTHKKANIKTWLIKQKRLKSKNE
eukprot:COSAG01_NODE_662_length_14431_cov_31.385775_13_plen_761_part_00